MSVTKRTSLTSWIRNESYLVKKLFKASIIMLFLLVLLLPVFNVPALTAEEQRTEATPMISTGFSHSLALKIDGTVWAWGRNYSGELGDGTTNDTLKPQQVPDLTGIVAVSAGDNHSLALTADGRVWAWGWNELGQLGDGTTTDRHEPVQISDLSSVVAISGGGAHSLAVTSDGQVWAWGTNSEGQLGDGTTTDRHSPVQASGLTNIAEVSAGIWHSLALTVDGKAWAWGYNDYGQLGDSTVTDSYSPVQVTGLTNVISVSAGFYNSLALTSDGKAWAWGLNAYGELGDDTTTDRYTPVQVSDLTNVVAISAGEHRSLAVTEDGKAWTWGRNHYGQLGDGTTTDRHTPVQVSGLTNVVAGSAKRSHSLALKRDNTVWAWGAEPAEFLINLGDPSLDDVVNIPDEKLEQAIRDELDKPTGDITVADMEGLTNLNAMSKGIEELTGLEHSVNLETLWLSSNAISDISPLSNLSKLESIELWKNNISDISPLSNLSNLESLDLSGNNISDISPLSDLSNLRLLYLSGNDLSNLTPLSNLNSLETLYLWGNDLSNLTPLSNLSNLESLDLSGNNISDISPLSDLSNMRFLGLSDNDLSDISTLSETLSDLNNLESLGLSSNAISDISPLSNLSNLEMLWLSSNDISDISPLSNLSNLEALWLSSNAISDISPLSVLTELEVLWLRNNNISDISPLSVLVEMKQLVLGSNEITDISALSLLTGLISIDLHSNDISDISPLSDLLNLDELRVEKNYIDISEGSPAMGIINDFIDAGVDVTYEPQYDSLTEDINARIDDVSITPEDLEPGDEITLQMTFTNTGDKTHTFIAGASLWEPGSDFSSSDQDFEKSVILEPGEEEEVSWKYTVEEEGDWAYQFAVWEAKPFISENLLHKYPSPVGFFYVSDNGDTHSEVKAVELSAEPTNWQYTGEDITFTAEVTEGNKDAEFAFYYQLADGRWTLGRSYSEDNTWTARTGYVGEVKIGVIARAVGSEDFEEARDIIDYNIIAPVEEVKLTAEPVDRQMAGEPVTFTAKVTEGNQDAEFAFYYQLTDGRWTLGRSYSENNTWTANTNYIGEVKIGVIARAVGTDVFEEARDIVNYEIFESIDSGKFEKGDTVRVTSQRGLNLRRYAGTDHESIWLMPYGTRMVVTNGRPEHRNGYIWWELEGHGKSGWAVERYLNKVDEDEVILDVPYIHQEDDTKHSVWSRKYNKSYTFDGQAACGATSAVMIAAYHDRLGDEHGDDLGKYVCKKYTNTEEKKMDWVTQHSNTKYKEIVGAGAFGYIHRSDRSLGDISDKYVEVSFAAAVAGRAVSYFKKHGLNAEILETSTRSLVRKEIDQGRPIYASILPPNSIGHIVTIVGYTGDDFVIHDPYYHTNCRNVRQGKNVVIPWGDYSLGDRTMITVAP